MLNYNDWSKKYDKTRKYNPMILTKILEYAPLREDERVLDFGCGTGNYLEGLSQLNSCQLYGIDASAEMIEIAYSKDIKAKFHIGNHKAIPFPNEYFDFIYILDVLQHIPQSELPLFYAELNRVLKPAGKILILTVSHQQLKNRSWNSYFPSAASIQLTRFPDISLLCELGEMQNLMCEYTLALEEIYYEPIPELFVKHVCNKAYSIFHLLDEQEYQKGKNCLLKDFDAEMSWEYNHGETIIIFIKTNKR